jgi:hypothetical protein
LKPLRKIFIILLVLSGLSFSVFSQGSAMAVAIPRVSATIVEPGTITSNFGDGVVIFAGTVILTPVRGHTKTSSLSLPVSTGSFTGAFFCVAGTNTGYNFTIDVPSSPVSINNGGTSMKITSFTSEPALNARSDMIAGVFVSVTPLDVTVNYN